MKRTTESLRPSCPYCLNGQGRVYAVSWKDTTKTISFRCEGCAQTWTRDEHDADRLDNVSERLIRAR